LIQIKSTRRLAAERSITLVFRAFTAAMMRAAQGQGVKLRDERITGLIRRADG